MDSKIDVDECVARLGGCKVLSSKESHLPNSCFAKVVANPQKLKKTQIRTIPRSPLLKYPAVGVGLCSELVILKDTLCVTIRQFGVELGLEASKNDRKSGDWSTGTTVHH